MNQERWKEIDESVADALELPEREREAFLAERLGGEDGSVLAEALRLVAGAEGAEQLFGRSPFGELTVLEAGSRIGPWELLKPLGSGGMGVVWLARRADGEATMLAAVKLLPMAMAGALEEQSELRQRFLVEKQILAQLDHPNIARLLDAGAEGGGTPNFVMEFVNGKPLLGYLLGRKVGREERLRLFLKICDAVQYAHGNLIVHRDLKPQNILVQANGEPKLLDFGIGKILGGAAGTMTVQRAFSLDYASPEQIRGGAIGTATDIFSLGLILFEMLTGERARRWDEKALGEVLEEGARFVLPALVGLSTDVMAVLRKATAAEAGARYRTVSELAGDVGRVLDGRPVEARAAGWLYRVGCVLRRNRVAAGAGGMAVLMICVLGAWGWVSAGREREQTQQLEAALGRERAARQAADAEQRRAAQMGELASRREREAVERLAEMRRLFEQTLRGASGDVAKLAGGTKASVRLIERALGELKALPGKDAAFLALQAEAHGMLAELYWGPNQNLGDEERAAEHRRAGAALWRRVRALAPEEVAWERAELEARFQPAGMARYESGVPSVEWRRFEREFLRLAARAPGDAATARLVGTFYFYRGFRGEKGSAGADYERSLGWFLRAFDEKRPTLRDARNVALAHKYLAGAKRGEEQLRHAGEALRLDRLRAALDPSDTSIQMDLAFSINSVADAKCGLRRGEEARQGYWESFQLRRRLAEADPENALVGRSLLYPLRHHASISYELGDWVALGRAVEAFDWLAGRRGGKLEGLDAKAVEYWKGILAGGRGAAPEGLKGMLLGCSGSPGR
jgi:hypothetical protein